MKYDKNAILNTAQNLRFKSSGLSVLQTKLSRISPMKCSSSFYAKRSSLVCRLSNVQSEINSLSCDIGNAANKMSSDDVQNARYIRQAFNNRTSKITFGQRLFSPGNTTLKRSGIFGSPLIFSRNAISRRPVSTLGNSTSGKIPWYQKVGNFFQRSATAIGNATNSVKDSVCNGYEYVKNGAISFGNKVGEFGTKAWNNASNFFSNAGKWGTDRLNDIKDWGNSAKDYVWKSVTKFVLGDYSEDNFTALSFIGNIATSIFGVDLPLDVRDLVYDVQHWGKGDNFGLYFALDVVALLPIIGVFKYCKYADDVVDGAKDLGKVLDAASDAGKYTDQIADVVDDAKDFGKAVDVATDTGKVTDDISDVSKNLEKITPSKAIDAEAKPRGSKTKISDNMNEENIRSLTRENEAAEILAKKGYDIEQNPMISGTTRNPDYIIEGKIFDCYSPTANKSVRGVWSTIYEKVITKGQTNRVVLNLGDWTGNVSDLIIQLKNYRIEGLEEVIVVIGDDVTSIFP